MKGKTISWWHRTWKREKNLVRLKVVLLRENIMIQLWKHLGEKEGVVPLWIPACHVNETSRIEIELLADLYRYWIYLFYLLFILTLALMLTETTLFWFISGIMLWVYASCCAAVKMIPRKLCAKLTVPAKWHAITSECVCVYGKLDEYSSWKWHSSYRTQAHIS